jgi:transcriptional regulator with XRE-family HTH domain
MSLKSLLSKLLLEARTRSALSQRDLARRGGTAQSVVARIELGGTRPTTATLERLVDAAGFELEVSLRPKAVLDPRMLDDVPRILRLEPGDRLREVGNISRLTALARRA